MLRFSKIVILLILLSSVGYSQRKADVIKIHTQYGDILVWLYNETPRHKASFIQLVKDEPLVKIPLHISIIKMSREALNKLGVVDSELKN